jgi:hypothetical protein
MQPVILQSFTCAVHKTAPSLGQSDLLIVHRNSMAVAHMMACQVGQLRILGSSYVTATASPVLAVRRQGGAVSW